MRGRGGAAAKVKSAFLTGYNPAGSGGDQLPSCA